MSSSSTASKLDELSGLQAAKRLVHALAKPDSGAHAVLFYGTEGSGKQSLAMELARAWMCRDNQGSGACGECPSCKAFSRGSHADLLFVQPHGPSDLITMEQIAEEKDTYVPIRTFLRTGPLHGACKVVLIERPDRMNSRSANALLKTLEEPTGHGKLILWTESVGRVLPTILSRCVAVACDLPEAAPPEVPDLAWKLARHAPGRAKRFADRWGPYERLLGFVDTLMASKAHHALALSERFQEIAEDFDESETAKRVEQSEGLVMLAEALRLKQAPAEWIQLVIKAHRQIAGNGNASIVFDSLFVQMLKDRRAGR